MPMDQKTKDALFLAEESLLEAVTGVYLYGPKVSFIALAGVLLTIEVGLIAFLLTERPNQALWAVVGALPAFLFTFIYVRWRDRKAVEENTRRSMLNIHGDLESLWEGIHLAQRAATETLDPFEEEVTIREITTRLDENLKALGRIIQKLGNYIRYTYGKEEYWGRLESKWKWEQSYGYTEAQVEEIKRRLVRKEWPWTLRGTEAVSSSFQSVPSEVTTWGPIFRAMDRPSEGTEPPKEQGDEGQEDNISPYHAPGLGEHDSEKGEEDEDDTPISRPPAA